MRRSWLIAVVVVGAVAASWITGAALALFTVGGIFDNVPLAVTACAFWAAFFVPAAMLADRTATAASTPIRRLRSTR